MAEHTMTTPPTVDATSEPVTTQGQGDWVMVPREWVQHIVTALAGKSPAFRRIRADAVNILAAAPSPARTEGLVDVDFEVWQDDMLVVSSTSEADARHYLAVYSQDGSTRLVRAEIRRTALTSATTPEPPIDDMGYAGAEFVEDDETLADPCNCGLVKHVGDGHHEL